jgi:hypothetical protein
MDTSPLVLLKKSVSLIIFWVYFFQIKTAKKGIIKVFFKMKLNKQILKMEFPRLKLMKNILKS